MFEGMVVLGDRAAGSGKMRPARTHFDPNSPRSNVM